MPSHADRVKRHDEYADPQEEAPVPQPREVEGAPGHVCARARAGVRRLLNAAQCSDGNPRPGQRDTAVDCQGIDMRSRRLESGKRWERRECARSV